MREPAHNRGAVAASPSGAHSFYLPTIQYLRKEKTMTDNENRNEAAELKPCCFICRYRDVRETSDEWLENFCRHQKAGTEFRSCVNPFGCCEYYEKRG